MVKGSQVLESVKQLDIICFDKTGTLTEGKFSITERRDFIEQEQINQLVAGMEAYSEHPLALPLKQLSATPRSFKEQVRMVAGSGLEVVTEQGEHYRLRQSRVYRRMASAGGHRDAF